MRKRFIAIMIASLCLTTWAISQNAVVEGYVFETDNRGYLREVKITVYSSNRAVKAEAFTNEDGFFTVDLVPGQDYSFKAAKSIFEDVEVDIKAADLSTEKTNFVKMEMKRKPGYLFDVTLSDSYFDMDGAKNGIDSAKIEIYNNTTSEESMVLEKHPFPNFTYTFEQGNHYTVMIRKEGYFTKRMEAHVNIDGCILCFEGMGQVRPSDNLTEGNTMGSLIANVELDKIRLSQGIKIENIYYDYNSANIRSDAAEELDKIIAMMKDNPTLIVELGSHTDSRGRDEYNMDLSERRAKSAVAYVMQQGSIPAERISAKGYGESQIINRCTNDVACNDQEHEQNRRTMIKIVGYTDFDPYEGKSLREIIYYENLENASFADFESIEFTGDGSSSTESTESNADAQAAIAAEIERDLKRQRDRALAREKAKEEARKQMIAEAKAKIAAESPETTEAVSPNSDIIEEVVVDTKPTPKAEADVVITPKKKQIRKPKVRKKKEEEIMASKGEEDKTGAFGEEVTPPEEKLPLSKANVTSHLGAKDLDSNYSGFMIEFFNSSILLSSDHSIFKQYGQIKLEKKENGEFAYLIGGFNTEQEALDYMEKVITPRFPASEVIRYIQGYRIDGEE